MNFDSIVRDKLSELDLSRLDEIINEADIPAELTDGLSLYGIVSSLVTGDVSFSMDNLKTLIYQFFLSDFKSVMVLGAELLIVGIIAGLMKNMDSSFGNDTVSKMSSIVCGCIAAGICLAAFSQVYESCSGAVKYMTLVMEAVLPVLFTLIISMGGLTTANVMNAVILGSVTSFSAIVLTVVLPAVFFSSVFTLGNSLSRQNYIKKLASFSRSAALFIIGACITIFSGISSIQGMMTSSADGLLMKTAKYSVDNLVPVVGGFAADSVEMVITCSGIIKNGIGILGIIVIALILLSPLVKVAAITIMFKLTAIIIEPVGDDTISDCMNELGSTSAVLGAVLFLSALMFFIYLTILISITIVR